MDKFVIVGGKKLSGKVNVSGAKNAALKALVAACLTKEKITIHNFPLISDLFVMKQMIELLGGKVEIDGHTVTVEVEDMICTKFPLDTAAKIRTSIMFIAPLLARLGKAIVPNPGGDKIGLRPVDRIIEGLSQMQATISYEEDGYFHGATEGLVGTTYTFTKNTHTGTETLIMAAALAKGTTVLKNAAQEPEVDELIALINSMGGNIRRSAQREITIVGVEKLHGAEIHILPDRNEIITFAIAALVTKGDITVIDGGKAHLTSFLEVLKNVGGGYELLGSDIRFFYQGELQAIDITTAIHPGFMTDWQAPVAVLLTQAKGESLIHETVFEYRFGYVKQLQKMGGKIEPIYDMVIEKPEEVYNFNLRDKKEDYFQAIRISGPTQLVGAEMTICDLRAGATLVLAALCARGQSTIYGLEQIDRGYESFEKRLQSLGADIQRI